MLLIVQPAGEARSLPRFLNPQRVIYPGRVVTNYDPAINDQHWDTQLSRHFHQLPGCLRILAQIDLFVGDTFLLQVTLGRVAVGSGRSCVDSDLGFHQ